jgi:hypothetical protein
VSLRRGVPKKQGMGASKVLTRHTSLGDAR